MAKRSRSLRAGPSPPPRTWVESDDEERAGPFGIRLLEPGRWELTVEDRPAGEYSTRTGARNAARDLHRRRRKRRRLLWWTAVVVVSTVVMLTALALRTEPNPEYPAARAIADRLDAARAEVEAGAIEIDDVAGLYPPLQGASFEHGGLRKLGIAGVFGEDCYGMVWRPGLSPSGFVIRSEYVTCAPDPSLIDQPDPPGLTAEPMAPSWTFALPPVERSPVWFFPVFLVSFGVMFAGLVRLVVITLPSRPR